LNARRAMAELLLRKMLACRERIAKIRAALPADPASVATDERLEAYLSFQLFLLIQDAVDLAAHLVAALGLAVPSSRRESFEALTKAGILSPESARAMSGMASLRNRIAHSYGDLDVVRMVRELPVGLQIATRYLDELLKAIPPATP
jgi:uncharacterized protein YutE (UPF0331/DUF86 family)